MLLKPNLDRRLDKMSVVIIGGHDRMEHRYREICAQYGYKCKVFTQNPTNLKEKIGTPDLMVLFIKTVAHKMVITATRQAEKTDTLIEYCCNSSASALKEVLKKYR